MFSKLRKSARHPVRAIREPFGKAGLTVAVIALVMAMVGGAYAAGKLNGTQKKEVERIAKKFAGKDGAPGIAGTNGTNGANGKDGASGQNGAPGADGQSVTTEPIATGEECGLQEGVRLTSASGDEAVCNGEEGPQGPEGSPWTLSGTLPHEKTETGAWSLGTISLGAVPAGVAAIQVPISFPIPLAADIANANVQFHAVGFEGTAGENCPGKASAPAAKPGFLCIYTGVESAGTFSLVSTKKATGTQSGASTTGAVMQFAVGENANARGTFAVTAP